MIGMSDLAKFVSDTAFFKLSSETVENIKIHLLDTIVLVAFDCGSL